ncbi:MAG: hypothetical protein K0U67_00530 [Actinomycetia bacterium]|nr:hypothetical protein [Actinomycetes bacterium]
MPSIPQSLLWISLVVLWLFVLVPMLINKRDTVRRTSDIALATRVLNGRAKSRLIRRGRPAAGHRHDPDWQSAGALADNVEDIEDIEDAQHDAVADYDDAVREARMRTQTPRSVMVVAGVVSGASDQTRTEPDYLDVDVVDENSGALPVGGGVQEALFDAGPVQAGLEKEAVPEESAVPGEVDADVDPATEEFEAVAEEVQPVTRDRAGAEPEADEYEYVDDTSGLEAEEGPAVPIAPRSNRQRRLESTTAAAVSARKYRFRRRMLTVMATIMVATAVLSFTVSPALWWPCAATAGVMVLYLAYLRRQTRIEEQVRRRRQQRMARMRAAEFDGLDERGPEVGDDDFPTRLQRPGTAVLEIDDEDPVFEHLDEVAYSRRFDPRDLPRAAGQ